MKLCSICDKKISGTWCKTCHRFVKTYDLPGRIHLNESHNPANDADCTYHVDVKKSGNASYTTVTRETGTTATRQIYTQTGTGTKSSATDRKKKGKLAIILIVLYVMINLLVVLVPTIINFVGSFSEGFREGFREEYEADDPFAEMPEQNESEFNEPVDTAYEEKLTAMKKLVPLEESEAETYVFRYYDPEEIANLDFACDEEHFDWSVPEFEEWLTENWSTSYETEDDSSEYYNYFYEDEEFTWFHFSVFRDYYESDDFAVRVSYDTVTGQLHMIDFVAIMDSEPAPLYYELLKELEPETEWSETDFLEALKGALEREENVTFYSSDVIEIGVQVKEGYYFVTCYPAYKY